MAKDEEIVVAIDIGTSKICTMVGKATSGQVEILGMGFTPSKGMRKGIVVNTQEIAGFIIDSVEKAEKESGFEIESAVIGITGGHIRSFNNKGETVITGPKFEITSLDKKRALKTALKVEIPPQYKLIHSLIRYYIVDGQKGINNPIGMFGTKLEAEVHIVLGVLTSIRNLIKALNLASIEVEDIVLESVASSLSILSEEEKNEGVALIDIGAGTTDVAVFVDGSILYSFIVPVGGETITNDIRIGLKTSYKNAERIKCSYAIAMEKLTDPGAYFFLEKGSEKIVTATKLCYIVEPRLLEIFEIIYDRFEKENLLNLIPRGLVLSGGSSHIYGIDEIAKSYFLAPVRIGIPKNFVSNIDNLENPIYSTCIGLLLYGMNYKPKVEGFKKERKNLIKGLINKVRKWFSEMLK
ncbi:MAG: cell division protein FtsA [Actinobacteria bacterium]|nr:cell division protein FtsA [Actinomycetota bacterium]